MDLKAYTLAYVAYGVYRAYTVEKLPAFEDLTEEDQEFWKQAVMATEKYIEKGKK